MAARKHRGLPHRQKREGFEVKKDDGIILGTKGSSFREGGTYIPGVRKLSFKLLMNAITGQLAR
jgi:histidinol dehydrogenase